MFFQIDALKYFAIFRGKHQCWSKEVCWSLFLIKLQDCNFPTNIAKFFRTAFFITPLMAASEKFINFPGKHQ